jgi:hypothetical protein
LISSTSGLSATHNAGIYYNVPLFNKSGAINTTTKATIVTSETAVTSVEITTPGSGYNVGDVLTIEGSDIGRFANLTFILVADEKENDMEIHKIKNTFLKCRT